MGWAGLVVVGERGCDPCIADQLCDMVDQDGEAGETELWEVLAGDEEADRECLLAAAECDGDGGFTREPEKVPPAEPAEAPGDQVDAEAGGDESQEQAHREGGGSEALACLDRCAEDHQEDEAAVEDGDRCFPAIGEVGSRLVPAKRLAESDGERDDDEHVADHGSEFELDIGSGGSGDPCAGDDEAEEITGEGDQEGDGLLASGEAGPDDGGG